MRVRILGSAAGGGLPQWNCACAACARARGSAPSLAPRSQSSVAVSADGRSWVLLNASPDVRTQLAMFADLGPPEGTVRGSAIRAVAITSADIDHVAGLLVLREGGAPAVYATQAVQVALREGLPLLETLRAYGPVVVRDLVSGVSVRPADREEKPVGLEMTPFLLSGAAPLYMRARGKTDFGDNAHVVGLRITDGTGTLVYAPGVRVWEDSLAHAAQDADLLLVDGTCFTDTELVDQGISGRRAQEMGHLPLGGNDGLLRALKNVERPRKVLVHVNNTNPVLSLDDHPEIAQALTDASVEVGHDGMEFFV